MAMCWHCKKNMSSAKTTSCDASRNVEFADGEVMPAIPYHLEFSDMPSRCHDCNVAVGGYHHPGCDMEECPRCGGQLISCGCLDVEGG